MIKIEATHIRRNTTNSGEPAKHYFKLLSEKGSGYEDCVDIVTLILTTTPWAYRPRYERGRTYKGKTLVSTSYIMRRSSVEALGNWLKDV